MSPSNPSAAGTVPAPSPQTASDPPARPSPAGVRRRMERLRGQRDELRTRREETAKQLGQVQAFLDIADDVTDALEQLSEDLFRRELTVIESTLTKALQEVLEQPIQFRASASFKRDAAHVEFDIVREGNAEDIMRGQGGSVANVVSVGLRMFAITMLDPASHRRFLVLDEQDCWLHPDLVSRLVRIVHEAGRALGFQVLMISHHDVGHFLRYADQVYRLTPDRGDGVNIEPAEREAPQDNDDG